MLLAVVKRKNTISYCMLTIVYILGSHWSETCQKQDNITETQVIYDKSSYEKVYLSPPLNLIVDY